MKKLLIAILMISLLGGFLTAETMKYDAPLLWKAPELMAQGNSTTANVTGYNSLFTNPAGFRMKGGDLNLVTIQPTWAMELFNFMADMEDPDKTEVEAILDQITSNGLGAGAQTSVGYVGRGLGLGGFMSVDAFFPRSESTLGARGDIYATAGMVAGYSLGFDALGWNWKVGADIRPMVRYLIDDVSITTITDLMGDSETPEPVEYYQGFGMGFDFGVQANWRLLTLGMSLRDIGHTKFAYTIGNLDVDAGTLDDTGVEVTDTYAAPMTLRLGAAVHPKIPFLSFLADPQVHAEVAIPLVNEDNYSDYNIGSFWTRLNLGADVTLLKMLSLRTGLNGGYLTAGAGLDLLFMEVNVAVFSQETGLYAGDERVMGGSVDFSLRF
jgi:hypothetical protein